MRLYHLDRSDTRKNSLSVSHNKYPHFLKLWHYHEQLELVLILKSTGTRFVGNSIEKFSEGEVILLGKNIPHMWLNDPSYFRENSGLEAEAIAIHFKEEFLYADIGRVPEFRTLKTLFERAKGGLKFTGDTTGVARMIKEMLKLSSFDRILKLLMILHELARRDSQVLSKAGFNESFEEVTGNMDRVYAYIYKNFRKPVSLGEAAGVINMHPAAFSRLFKKASRKTFSRYLNEIRVGYACKLILEQKYTMSEICYESGFHNSSNFNRQFRAITSLSPTEYLEKHLKIYN